MFNHCNPSSVSCQLYKERVRTGYEVMIHKKVAICGTVRDCGGRLESNISRIETLRSCFKSSVVIIVENDSVDNTKSILSGWEGECENVVILTEDIGVETKKDVGGVVDLSFSMHRISNMARYRNKYLSYLSACDEIDYVIVVDLDLEDISLDGIASTFGECSSWDGVASNGLRASRLAELFKGYVYFDTYAFISLYHQGVRTKPDIYSDQHLLKGLKKYGPMHPVLSAFGGLAVYKYEAIMSSVYSVIENDDPEVEVLCEHIALHQKMKENGYGKIYINPAQVVIYDSFKSKVKNVLRRNFGFNS